MSRRNAYLKLKEILVLTFSLILAAAGLRAQENYKITGIEIEGNQFISKAAILEQITTQAPRIWEKLMFWKEPYLFSENTFERDLHRIIDFYFREGFVNAHIDTVIFQTDEKKETVKILIRINEGPPLFIREVHHRLEVPNDSLLPRVERILAALQKKFILKSGMRYRDETFLLDQQTILNKFNDEGFPFVKIKPFLGIDKDENRVDILIRIETGPLCYFGEITISGNETVPASLIRKQLTIRKGRLFTRDGLNRSQRQIYQLGVFQFVMIRVNFEDMQNAQIPVHIRVKEAPQWTVKIGAGFGREDQFRGFVDAKKLNFWGGARRLRLFVKHSGLEPLNVNLGLTQPAFLSSRNTLNINPFYREESEPGFRVKRVGGNLTVQRYFGRSTDGYLNYNLEQVQLDVPDETRYVALDSSKISLYNKSSITFGIARDNSGPLFEPTHGGFQALTLTYSGLGFRSDFEYLRVLIEIRKYLAVNELMTLALRGKIGAMASLNPDRPTPIEERFFSGGSNSIRGWARSRLGPKNRTGRPIGGNSMLETSIELRFHIWKWFSGVLFLDSGYVWKETLNYDISQLKHAGGLGLRVRTPIGPLRLDIAKSLNTFDPAQIHVSIGHAF